MQPVIVFLRLRAQEMIQITKSSTDKKNVERLEEIAQEMMEMAEYLEGKN